ncbi:MAG: tryptophan synthase subunit alpha, partial [Nitrososphaeria archaeon]
ILKKFSNLRNRGEGALIAYLTAGYPTLEHTPKIAHTLVSGGADIIELGIPFSDPIADGPIIQSAMNRALKLGTTPLKVLKMAEDVKEENDVPILILTYYNPIFKMGLRRFFETARGCGVDGVIVPDLPIEEAGEYKKVAEDNMIDTIFLATPSTTVDRLKAILEYTSGFLYLVSVHGVTGVRPRVQDTTIELVKRIVAMASGKIPVAVGFGVSKPEHVSILIGGGADGVIVGSVFMKMVEENMCDEERMLKMLKDYVMELKKATRAKCFHR